MIWRTDFLRMIGWLTSNSPWFGRLIEGNKIVLFENKKMVRKNLRKALVCEEDILQGVRKAALTENLETIDKGNVR